MNILVITYWSYKEPLIHAWTLPYLRMIRQAAAEDVTIHLLTLEKPSLALTAAELETEKASLSAEGIQLIDRKYYHFGWRAMSAWFSNLIMLRRYMRKHTIDVIHAFGSPAATTAYSLSRLSGTKYIIDSYEPHAESMVENGSWEAKSLAFRVLSYFEKIQTKKAFAVLATTEGMRDYALTTYGHVPRIFLYKPAIIDPIDFSNKARQLDITRSSLGIDENAVVGIYAGKLGGIYLRDELFDLYKSAFIFWGRRFHVIMLSDLSEQELCAQCERTDVPRSIFTLRFVTHDEVPAYLGLADFAINPVKPVPSKRYCTSIKDGEYWAAGLPVIITKGISDDSEIIANLSLGAVLDDLNPKAYDKAMQIIDHLISAEHRSAARARIQQAARTYRHPEIAKAAYQAIYGLNGYLRRASRHYLVLIYNSFMDPLFQNLMYAYLTRLAIHEPTLTFDLLTFEQKKYAIAPQRRNAIHHELATIGIHWRPMTYHSGRFMFIKKVIDLYSSFIQVVAARIRRQPKMIIAFANNSAAISLIISKLLRTPLMVYSFEPHSEFLAEFGIWKRTGWRYRILHALEQRVSRDARYLLTGTRHMVDELKGGTKAKVLRAPSSVDESVFRYRGSAAKEIRSRLRITDKQVLIYAGKFGGIYYEHAIGEFCAALREDRPDRYFIFLTPSEHSEVRELLINAGLQPDDFHISEAHGAHEVAAWLSAADIGLTAIPPFPSQRYRSPVKTGEYLMCGIPYITCKGVSEDDSWAEEHRVGIVVESLNQDSARSISSEIDQLLEETDLRNRCRETGIAYRGRVQVDEIFHKILTE